MTIRLSKTAKLQEQSKTASEMQGVVGTLAYMAPELFDESPATYQSDLYAVGVIAYEMFTGNHPFNTKNVATLVQQIMMTEPNFASFSAPLAAVLKRLMNKMPNERYDDLVEVIEALCRATGQVVPEENVLLRDSFLQASSFVGRESELDTLKQALTDAWQSKGSVWLIGGESGVGKSRLVQELRTRALVQGATVYNGQAIAETDYTQQIWLNPIRQLALSVELTDLEVSIFSSVVPDILELIGRPIPTIPVLEGAAGSSRFALTLSEVFSRACQEHGLVVIILEDLHERHLETLNALSRLRTQLALLVVGIYRDDEAPTLPKLLSGDRL